MERFSRRYPKPNSSRLQYNLFKKTETVPPRKTNAGEVCVPFSLLLSFTIIFIGHQCFFLSCKFVFCCEYCVGLLIITKKVHSAWSTINKRDAADLASRFAFLVMQGHNGLSQPLTGKSKLLQCTFCYVIVI